MIAAWMLGSIVLGAVIALGALALDAASRAAHRSVRWTWAGAISAIVVLTMLLPIRRASNAGPIHIGTVTTVTSGAALPDAGTPLMLRALATARSAMDAPFAQLVRPVARSVSPAANQWLLGGWIVCSLALLLLGAYVLRRLLDARRSWPVESLHGERVRVAPSAGPAVMGFVRGAIVVPCWLAECPPEVQQVVLAHEREHLRARDPLLLALGAVAVILLPWNPAVWWMLARLRLAVELDCDRRVIGGGVRARDYGTLLVKLFFEVSPEVQDRRLRERALSPWAPLLTRDPVVEVRHPEYAEALHQLRQNSDTRWSPWRIIDGNDDAQAAIAALSVIADAWAETMPAEPPRAVRSSGHAA